MLSCAGISLLALLAYTTGAVELPEASQVALEAGRTLLPYEPLVDKIEFELKSIRKYFTAVSGIQHQEAFIPGQLIGEVNPDQARRLNSSAYGPVTIIPFEIVTASALHFTRPYNGVVLSRRLKSEFGIDSDPNYTFGRSQIITYNPYRKEYTFYQGSGDCPSGCIENYYWVFKEYSDGYIRLLRQSEGRPPNNLAAKNGTKHFAYVPKKEEATRDGDVNSGENQDAGILAAKFKLQ